MKKHISKDFNKFKVLKGVSIEKRIEGLIILDAVDKKYAAIHNDRDYLYIEKEYIFEKLLPSRISFGNIWRLDRLRKEIKKGNMSNPFTKIRW